MKRFYFSGIAVSVIAVLSLVISKKILPDDHALRDFELIFYQENDNLFYKSNGSVKKIGILDTAAASAEKNDKNIEMNIMNISMLKYNGRQLYFTGEGGDLVKLELETGLAIKFSDAVKKPVDYDKNLKRTIVDFDDKTGVALYAHDMIGGVNEKSSGSKGGQKIKHNFSSSEQFYTLAGFKNRVYVGTAVNGLYYSTNELKAGAPGYLNFASLNAGLPFIPFEGTIRFYEEIHSLHVSKQGDIFAGIGIQGGVYLKKASQNRFQPLPWPDKWKTSDVYSITTGNSGIVWVSCTQGLIIYTPTDFKDINIKNKIKDGELYKMQEIAWSEFSYPYKTFLMKSTTDPDLYAWYRSRRDEIKADKLQRMKTASSKRLFYSSPYNLKIKPAMMTELLKSDNYDGIVIDVKDDRGYVLYKSNVPFVNKIGALYPVMDLPAFVQMAHEYKKYVAVRIVVFKDPVLFEQPGYAIWDVLKNKPWTGNEQERWIDPFNASIAEKYYAPLVKELTTMGVDEIQFDYIRFPSDGPINLCLFRNKTPGKYFSEAIEDFLYQVRQATPLPISLDIYGYQGLYRTGGAIGQDMLAFGRFADVISPMLYSSHFGNEYMTDRKKEDRVYALIKHSIRRAEFIAQNRFLIRPYLQAFPMKAAIWGYGDAYFLDQIKASHEEQGSGYSFWGSIDHMLAVDRAINTLK